MGSRKTEHAITIDQACAPNEAIKQIRFNGKLLVITGVSFKDYLGRTELLIVAKDLATYEQEMESSKDPDDDTLGREIDKI